MKNKYCISFIVTIITACIILIVFLISGNRGNTSHVKRVIGYSELYDEKLINKAFDVIEDKFGSDFKGCTLTQLRYDETVENEFAEEMMSYFAMHKQALIIVSSDFDTGRKAGDLGFIPNESYQEWTWCLVRRGNSQEWEWEIVENGWGY